MNTGVDTCKQRGSYTRTSRPIRLTETARLLDVWTTESYGSFVRVQIDGPEGRPIGTLLRHAGAVQVLPAVKAALLARTGDALAGPVSPGTLHRCVRLGIAVEHGLVWRLTPAGQLLRDHLNADAAHRTRVVERGLDAEYNHVRGRRVVPPDRWAWSCSCGIGEPRLRADEARQHARLHREEGWMPAIITS